MTEDKDFNCQQLQGKSCQRWCGEEQCALATPYPWCHGSPTKQDCIKRGYCNRDPNCGE